MNNRAGKFIKIGSGVSQYSCFVPELLPPGNPPIRYDDEMIFLISEANRLIGRLDEVTDTLISPNYFVYMYARKEATLSSQIEGTQATFSDLIKAEAGMADEVPNDVKEIGNYIKAINYGFERLETLPLSLRLIREREIEKSIKNASFICFIFTHPIKKQGKVECKISENINDQFANKETRRIVHYLPGFILFQ